MRPWLGCLTLIASCGLGLGGEPMKFADVPLPRGLVAADTVPAAGATVCFLEGPAVDAAGNVFFSDIAGNRILKLDAKGKVSVFRADSGQTNGNVFDAKGRLISCEGAEQGPGRRRIVRTDMETGEVTLLSDKYQGKRYNSPNDACVDRLGRIWFTDPRYDPDRSDLEMEVEGVYRIDPSGKVTRVLTQKEIHRPNGIAISPDAKMLYLVDSHPKPGGNRKIWAFDVQNDGSLAKQRLIFDFGKGRGGDGMKLDASGNLWVAAGISVRRGPGETLDVPPGVYVIAPEGKLLGRIPIPENLITNVAFGGPDLKTLYVTAGKTVYRFPVTASGYAVYPRLDADKTPGVEKARGARDDKNRLDGTWRLVRWRVNGSEHRVTEPAQEMIVSGSEFKMQKDGKVHDSGSVVINPDATPKSIDIRHTGEQFQGKTGFAIYKFQDDELWLAIARAGDKSRPADFSAPKGSDQIVFIFRRR